MTKEESLMMWKLELDNFNKHIEYASNPMKKLYKVLDKVINEGIVTYEDFTNDMIDELTTMTIENSKTEENKDRATEIDAICKRLTEKYEAKYTERESGTGDTELQRDSTEVPGTEELQESECVSEESTDDNTEIK